MRTSNTTPLKKSALVLLVLIFRPYLGELVAGRVRSMPALPLLSTELRLFSSQMYSAIVHSRCRRRFELVVYGAVNTTGSVIVVSMLMLSGSARRKRSTIRILSLGGTPPVSLMLGENPTLSTTSVSPSQRPTEVPKNFGSGSAGSFLPSV